MAADEIRFGRQVPWFTCYTSIWERNDLDAESKLVYINLASHAGNNQRAWPSYERIARQTGLSRRCVITRIKILIAKNLLVKRHRFFANGKQTSNLFIVFPAHDPFRPNQELIDSNGNLINKPLDIVGAHGAPQDLAVGVHTVHSRGAHGALKYDQFNNNTVVVVDQDDNKKLDKSENEEIVVDQNKPHEKSQTTTCPAAAPIPLADINRVIDAVKNVTGCVISQQDAKSLLSCWPVDYVLTKVNVAAGKKIDQNVVGWIKRCCEGDWVNVVKPGKVKNVKTENRPYYKETDNNYSASAAAAKKAMLLDYLQQSN